MLNFTGKNVLITGASRGIGRAAAQQFAQQGARVGVHYHTNRAAAQETLRHLPGGPHHLLPADVGDPAAVAAMVDQAITHLGRIHILVNNAGIYQEHPLATTGYHQWQESWQRVLHTNLLGAANVTHRVAHHMIHAGGGRIVSVSSRGAFRGEPDAPAYGASKAALNAMSQSLARHLAPHNIFVAVVAPGFVDTDMAADHLQGQSGEAIRSQSPLNRVARPQEVAYTILFLASPGAEFLTGAIVDVNGASYLRT